MSPLDIAAATVLLVGAILAALGGIGLLRFPDVFTRMHAATKATTVGAVLMTAAAALEAGGLSGVLLLVLVIALLFLSGPLGMSLLARAAYHDPETPRSPLTEELDMALPLPESTPLRRMGGTSPMLAGWLLLVWVAGFGSLRWNVLIGGVLVAGAVALALRSLAPRWPGVLLRPVAALRFFAVFVWQLSVATWDVARTLARRPGELQPAIVEVPLRVRTRNEVTLLMNAVSFTPGTVALELHDGDLYLHVLHGDSVDVVLRDVGRLEDRIMAAFGPRSVDVIDVT